MTVLSGAYHKTAVCLALCGVLISGPAVGACLSEAQVARVLAKLGEYPRYRARIGNPKQPVRVYLNPTKKTYTIVVFDRGCAHPIISGYGWQPVGQRAAR